MYLITRLLTALLFSSLAFSAPTFSQTQSSALSAADEAAIRSVVTQFFNLYPKKDSAAIFALWSEKSPFIKGSQQELQRIFTGAERIEVKNLTVGKTAADGERVKVRALVEFSATAANTGKPFDVYLSQNRMVMLVREAGGWKILRHISAERDLALRLVETKGEAERAALLKAENELVNINLAKALRDEGDRLDGEIPTPEVIAIYRLGMKIAEQLGDKNEMVRALNDIALTVSGQDKNEALKTYREAIKLCEEIGYKEMIPIIFQNVGVLYFDWGNFDKALDYAGKGFAVAEDLDDKGLMADTAGLIANVYNIKGDYSKSLEYHGKAKALREQLNDTRRIAFSLNDIGQVQAAQGDYARAIESFQQSLKLVNQTGAVQFYNLGLTYKLQGDFTKAMNAYQKSVSLCEARGSDGCIAEVSVNIGDLYNAQGNYEQAAKYFSKSLAVAEKNGDKRNAASALGGIAQGFQAQGEYQKAIEIRQKVLALYEEMGYKAEIIHSLNEIGSLFYALGDLKQAEDYYRRSLKLNESLGDNAYMTETFLSLADIQLSKGDNENALKSAEQARFFYEKLIGAAGNWKLYSTLGQAYQGLGQPTEARQNYEKAVAAIENLRANTVGNEEERQRFLGDKISAYDLLIGFLISQKNTDEAFAFAERTKSRSLLDVLQNGRVDLSKAMSAAEKQQEQRLKNELVSFNAQISKENVQNQPNKTRLADLQNQLEKKRLEFEDFQTRLYALHPELKVQRGEMTPVSREESAALLPDNRSALLEYTVAQDKTFLFVLTKDALQKISLKVYPIEIKQKDLAAATESFREKLAKGDLDFGKQAQDLYDLLLKPAAAQLKNKTNLTIVPDAALWDLPFQALETAPNKYLVETAAVSYAPSFTALREMTKKNKGNRADATLLAFGNPTVGKETSEKVKQVFMGENLAPLPEAERLVTSLGKLYGGNKSKIFVGSEAREEIAKAESPKYRIVQFAAHGILNDVSPMYSHIVLAQKENDANEDGLLEAWEMKDLNLNADIVILSACETARGKVSNGEGVIGMSWALFIAGAPTTVASQWKVESSSTTELMLEFHRQLLSGKGASKAEALRQASLKLMKLPQYKHPSYWAGFVMVGNSF